MVSRDVAVPWGCLRFVIVVFPDHTHLLFLSKCIASLKKSKSAKMLGIRLLFIS